MEFMSSQHGVLSKLFWELSVILVTMSVRPEKPVPTLLIYQQRIMITREAVHVVHMTAAAQDLDLTLVRVTCSKN